MNQMNRTGTAASCQQSAGEVAHGVPHGQEAYGEDGDEDNDHVEGMDADGIGIDNERPFALSQSDDSELLLNPAKQQSHHYADDGADERDETALEQEYLRYLAVAGPL